MTAGPIASLQASADQVQVLDQTLLPYAQRYVPLRSWQDVAHAICSMQVRGAPLIGVTAAYGLALGLREDASDQHLQQVVAALVATRPTAVNLHWALAQMQTRLQGVAPAQRAASAWQVARALQQADADSCAAIGAHGLPLLAAIASRRPGPVRVLTHCNAGALATLGIGTALAPVYAAQAQGVPVHVWVSETRPRNQGLLTLWELAQAGISHALIADNAAGVLLGRQAVDLVLTGADRIAANGDCANKVGTYLKALAAADQQVPFYVAAPWSTIDLHCAEGAMIPIEDRGAEEVGTVRGLDAQGLVQTLRLTGADTQAPNPAFDVTPARLVRGIITELGVHAPDALRQVAEAGA